MKLPFTGELPQREHRSTRITSGVPDFLKKHKGRWAMVRDYPLLNRASAYSYVLLIKSGQSPLWQPAKNFDAITRIMGDKIVVWVRYVGGEAS